MSLSVQQLGVRRGSDLAIEAISFDLEGGSLTALVGPNGAGKSTLLQAIAGQLPLASGSIQLDGQPLTLPLARRQLALMPQRGEIAWGFPITVRELVGLGRLVAARPGCCDVEAALQRVGLAGLAQRRLDQLSGGQQQRALLARTLVQPAQVLLLEEEAPGGATSDVSFQASKGPYGPLEPPLSIQSEATPTPAQHDANCTCAQSHGQGAT